MKRHIFNAAMLLCAGAMLMTGCNKDKEQVFHLTINDNQTKTHLGEGYTTWWDEGDVVYINGANTLTISSETGDFNPNGQVWVKPDVTLEPINSQFYAFYAGRGTNVVPSVTEGAQSYSFTMPATYTYNPSLLQSPMAGIGTYRGSDPNTQIDVPFDNLFALLELKVPIALADKPYEIEITDFGTNDVPLSGNFIATYNNGWSATYADDSSGSNSLTITKNTIEKTVFIPIPAGNHKLNIYIDPASYNRMYDELPSYNFLAGNYYKITLYDTNTIPIHDDTIIAAGKGNMRYFAANSGAQPVGWSLEPNQWDTTNYWAASTAIKSSQISWMPDSNCHPENLNNGGSVHGTYYTAGYPSLLGFTNTTHWRVLTREEWQKVLGTRPGDSPHYAYVSISYTKNVKNAEYPNGHDVNLVQDGLIIIPSGVDASVLSGTNIVKGRTYSASGTDKWANVPTITSEKFEELEEYGCTFLPAFGYVTHSGSSGQWEDNQDGYYRTCEPVKANGNGACAYVLYFTPSAAPSIRSDIQFGYGVAVRLFYVVYPNETNK